jgi:hypothetical protein
MYTDSNSDSNDKNKQINRTGLPGQPVNHPESNLVFVHRESFRRYTRWLRWCRGVEGTRTKSSQETEKERKRKNLAVMDSYVSPGCDFV